MRRTATKYLLLLTVLFANWSSASALLASDLDEFKVKREHVFEFTQKPTVVRDGDKVTITFTSKGWCDATVAIEDPEGKIVRHLACGVLGPKAPEPFRKNSKRQTLVWDGKNDQGKYIDDKDALTVRVSLGLKPRFERTLFWATKKRWSGEPPIICAAPEGVYVYDSGSSVDHIRLFDHKGDYVRTVYPFPANRIDSVHGLYRHTFPQDGATLPLKCNFLQTTMLTAGTNCHPVTYRPKTRTYESTVAGYPCHFGMYGRAARGMTVHRGKLALAFWKLNRFGADGGGCGPGIYGPKTSLPGKMRTVHSFRGGTYEVGPRSLALSPDGKWLYLSGYFWSQPWNYDSLHAVMRMPFDGDKPPQLFVGNTSQYKGGSGPKQLSVPTCVACDAKGRVYVADYMNDRIQVFSPDAALIKSIPATKPVKLCIDPRTGELWVFSWVVGNARLVRETMASERQHKGWVRVPAALRRYGPLEAPRLLGAWPLPVVGYNDRARPGGGSSIASGAQFAADVDFHTDPPTVWFVPGAPHRGRIGWDKVSIQLLQIKGGKLRVVRDFGKEVRQSRTTSQSAAGIRQRLYVNPATGCVYVANGTSFQDVTRIDPDTGRIKTVNLPFNSEEMCFDHVGRAYLRSMSFVARYDAQTWREVPWDYGEERNRLSFSSMSWARVRGAVSALPVFQGINWHMGGMHVSLRGRLAVACYVSEKLDLRTDGKEALEEGKTYAPRVYPGRALGHKRALVHVWDERGKLIIEDAVPGLPDLYGLAIDHRDGIYVLSSGTRLLDGVRYFNDMTGTIIKFRPRAGRVISIGKGVPVAVKPGARPAGPFDVRSAIQGSAWVKNPEWMYGGVGYCGKNRGVGCSCYNTRFALDYFARTFAPEMDRYSVAVLDSNGNLILRVGRYGNVDDGVPLITTGGPHNPRSIGGDEVALFHGAYVATQTDRRLFIADPGNARVLSVKLGYHAEERVPLKDAADETGR